MNSDSTHDELKALAGTYAVGALDGEELDTFSAHLLECWECRRTVLEFDEVYADGARGLPPVEPSAGVKQALLSRASGTGQALAPDPPAPLKRNTAIALKVAAAAGLLLASMAWQTAAHRAQQIEDLSRERDQIQAQLESQAPPGSDPASDPASDQAVLALLASPQTQTLQLEGKGPSPSASGRVLWQGAEVGLIATGLPVLPESSIYQLWAIVGDEKLGVGLFAVDASGAVRSIAQATTPIAKDVKAFALTVEPAGGKPQPTGAIHLLTRS